MGTYYYDNGVKFELPWNFEYSKEYDDEGKESYHIRTGSYYNDDGEKCYEFSCGIDTVEASDDMHVTSLRDMLENMLRSENKTRGLVFDGELEVALVTRGMPMNLFGTTLQYYTLVAFVLAGNEKVVDLVVVQMYEEDDEEKNLAVFENMATIIRSLSVNGKKNDLRSMDAKALHTALKPCFNEEDNIDIGARLWEMLGDTEEEESYADQPLPEGVCASEDGYAVINDDWAVRLPDGWVFSTAEEHTCGRPFAAISRKEYDESGRSPFAYGDNCFTVFRVAEAESNEFGMHSLLAGLMNSNEETVIDRPGLKVTYNCHHEGNTTYCQYVTVTTYKASYMVQLFYTDPYMGEFSRVAKIEEILKTICRSYEVPYSERYQRREHTKSAVQPVTTGKKRITFCRVCPDESLYPHYNSISNSPLKSLGLLGAKVVINSTGTEYAFLGFRSMLNTFSSDPTDKLSDEQRDRLTRILNSDTAPYDLHEKAKTMQSLFHVDPSVFDPSHDRECELEHGYMHRAYMMSALRSFAWTLSAYCQESGETPGTVAYSRIRDLIAYIAGHNWLNYDGEAHCPGLCGGSDLHVYFVPDGTSAEDRRQLRGDGMSEEEESRIREKFQNFNIIRSQVRSLDALRRDLAYIYPAVENIYDTLKASRNNREQLLGDEADILYAWCALALAAKEPFFTEDGPMNYCLSQVESEEEAEAKRLQREKAAYDAWMAEYGVYLTRNPQISFSGKLFVFSGLAKHADSKDHPTIQKVLSRGGEFRSKVSGLTNYLVVDPAYCGGSKLVTAIEQQKKGKPIQIILLEDLEAALGSSVSKITDTPVTKNTSVENMQRLAPIASEVSVKIPRNDPRRLRPDECNIDSKGVLLGYDGAKTDIVLPDCVTAIGEDAFAYNEGLKQVIIPDGVTSIGHRSFHGCTNLTKVIIPQSVKTIGIMAFWQCVKLTDVSVPNYVTAIGNHAFSECTELKSITIPGSVTSMGSYVFSDCTALENVILSKQLTTIENGTFNDCVSLSSITIPDGVKSIADYAFSGCTALKIISVPQSVEDISENTFLCSENLQCAIVSEGSYAEGYFSDEMCIDCLYADDIGQIIGEFIIDKDGRLDKYCGDGTDIVLPDGITAIGPHVFARNANLTSIIIPDSVTSIYTSAFLECIGLRDIKIPHGVTSISGDAFAGCCGLKTVSLPETLAFIEYRAFYKCTGLTNIRIPDSVAEIGTRAFHDCISLKKVTILAEDIIEFGDMCFFGCENLEYVEITRGSVLETYFEEEGIEFRYVGEAEVPEQKRNKRRTEAYIINKDGEFKGYFGPKKDITLPSTVKTVGFSCELSNSVERITIPDSVTAISYMAFSKCGGLKSVVIPESITKIEGWTFNQCTALENVAIPPSVKTIEGWAFGGCVSLKKIVIPGSVTAIDNWAFSGCKDLTIVAPSGSYAQQYAKEHEVTFEVLLDEETRKKEEEQKCKRREEEEAQLRALQRVREAAAAERKRQEERARKEEAQRQEYLDRCRREAEERDRKTAEEAERERKAEKEAEQKRQAALVASRLRYEEISSAIALQMQIISQNKGWFGIQAKTRKAAQQQLAVLQAQLSKEFPGGKP